jgi:HD-like signal output (HDOD) protein
MPELALRLRTALEDDSTDRREIVELIRAEPAVTTTLLRTAKSPALGFTSTTDLSQAVSRLGLKQVLAMVTAVLVQGQFEAHTDSNRKAIKTLWEHAIASATVAKYLAPRESYSPDDAFLAGLLHGIGRLLVLRALDRLPPVDQESAPSSSEVGEIVEALQSELGSSTLWKWNFKEDIGEAARAMDPGVDISARTITRIVRASDLITQKLGMHPHPDPDLDLLAQDAITSFDIGEEDLPILLGELEGAIDEVKSAFSTA